MTEEELLKGQREVRSHGMCGEILGDSNTGYLSYCALSPDHPGICGRVPDQDSDAELPSLVENRLYELEERVAHLEALLTPKAAAPPGMMPITSYIWPTSSASTDVATQQRRHFVPDFGSEGEY